MSEDFIEGTPSGEPSASRGDQSKLMESGIILQGSDGCGKHHVRRGMPAISADGEEVGWVAAVVVDAAGVSIGLLMARPQTTLEYYHLPLAMISRVDDEQVQLGIPAQAAWALPRRDASSTP